MCKEVREDGANSNLDFAMVQCAENSRYKGATKNASPQYKDFLCKGGQFFCYQPVRGIKYYIYRQIIWLFWHTKLFLDMNTVPLPIKDALE